MDSDVIFVAGVVFCRPHRKLELGLTMGGCKDLIIIIIIIIMLMKV